MAQTNFTPILLYASSTATNVPLAANLTNSATGSEIAINIADKNLFFKDSTNAVNTVPIRQSGTSSNGWLSNTDWNTFNGKAPATSGTSLLYGNGSGGFSNVTIGSGISFAGGTLSATGSGGTVTSVTGTSPVVSSGGTTPAISLATAYGDTLNPYASKTAKYVLAAPNASAGVPTFRQLDNTDITGFGTMSTQNANSVAITGGTLNGVAIGGTTAGDGTFDVLTANVTKLTNVTSSAGIVITGTFTGSSPTDGLVMDYATGWDRFSAFGGDGFQWFNAGLATTKLMELSSTGALATTGTVTANGVLLTGNLGTVTSVTGTSPVVSSGGTTPAISMPAATTSVSGYLTSTDWNTFNSKGSGTVTSVAALTLGTTGTDLSSTVANGTTTPVITLNVPTASATNRGALSAADWTTFNNKGNGTVTSVTGTAPVVSSGGTTPAISMAAATTSVSGYLTSTDWNTFNNKTSNTGTVTSVAASVPAFLSISGSPITTSGTLAITLSGTALPVANGGTGLTTLATGLIPFGNGTSAFNNSTNLYFDGTSLGIGTGVVGLGNKLVIAAGNAQTDPGYGLLQKNTSYGFYPNDNVAGMKISTNGLLNIYTGGTGTTLTATFNTSQGLDVVGNISLSSVISTTFYTAINSSTPTTIATGISFIAVVRDRGYGGSALVLYENNNTPVIISQVGTAFTTISPLSTQIQLANLSGGNGMTALAGSARNLDNINISVIKNQ